MEIMDKRSIDHSIPEFFFVLLYTISLLVLTLS